MDRDIQDAMARWSAHRARIEEEISRRQEASRYSTIVPRFHPPRQKEDLLEEEQDRGDLADFDAPDPDQFVYLSPYAAGVKQQAQLMGTVRIHSSLSTTTSGSAWSPTRSGRLDNGAMYMPPDRTDDECVSRLPPPGARLPVRDLPSKKKKRRGRSRSRPASRP